MCAKSVRGIAILIAVLAVLAGCGNFTLSGLLDTPPAGPSGLRIAPSTVNVTPSTVVQFSAVGGLPPYDWAADEGAVVNGQYSVPAVAGTYTVTVTDGEGTSSDATVIASTTIPLAISPISTSVDAGGTVVFAGNGGSGNPLNYSWLKTAGGGALVGSTYTAPWAVTTATIRLTDTVTLEERVATVTVHAPTDVHISPASTNVAAGGSVAFTATGGSGVYSYVKTAGGGSLVGAIYTAPWSPGLPPWTVQVTDTNTLDTDDAAISVSAPIPVQISPSGTIDINEFDSVVFSASGGSGNPLNYSWTNDSGFLGNLFGSTYTANAGAEIAVIRVTDTKTAGTMTATVNVTTPSGLTISPKTVTLDAGGSVAFTAGGGAGGYVYSQVSGSGNFVPPTYTAPWSATTAVIRVTDAMLATDDATVTVNPPPTLAINPSTATLGVGQNVTFTGSGGSGNPVNYSYTKISGGGALVGATYTAPGSATTAVIRLTDTMTLQTANATVTVNAPPPLTISPTTVNVVAGSVVTFTPGGGSGSYSFSLVSGIGSLVGAAYTTVSEETAVIRLTDTVTGNTQQATVTVYFPLTIIPTDATLQTGATYPFSAAGGIPPYTFSKVSGVGTMGGGGLYHADGGPGPAVAKVVDSLSNTSTATVAVTAPAGWGIVSIDAGARSGQFASLALTAGGLPRIAYYESQGKELRFASFDGSLWTHQVVDNAKSVGKYASLALEPGSGYARISYYDEKDGELQYAAWNGTTWVKRTVDSAGDVGQHASLALKPGTNHPGISYYDSQANSLKYAVWNGSAWTSQVVDSTGDVGQYTSLAFDTAGNPHIAYYDATNSALKYAAWNGSAWVMATVDSAGDVGQYASLALEPGTGRPRIAYYDATAKDLKYASWNGTAWDKETVESAGDVGQHASLALDPVGVNHHPRIACYDATAKDLKYASWNGTAWVKETVESAGDVGKYASLRLDAAGNPRIAYYNGTAQDLKFAQKP